MKNDGENLNPNTYNTSTGWESFSDYSTSPESWSSVGNQTENPAENNPQPSSGAEQSPTGQVTEAVAESVEEKIQFTPAAEAYLKDVLANVDDWLSHQRIDEEKAERFRQEAMERAKEMSLAEEKTTQEEKEEIPPEELVEESIQLTEAAQKYLDDEMHNIDDMLKDRQSSVDEEKAERFRQEVTKRAGEMSLAEEKAKREAEEKAAQEAAEKARLEAEEKARLERKEQEAKAEQAAIEEAEKLLQEKKARYAEIDKELESLSVLERFFSPTFLKKAINKFRSRRSNARFGTTSQPGER